MKENGDCYLVAGQMIMDINVDGALLCHGNPIGQGEIKGIKHNHAWIEINDIVLDFSNGNRIITWKNKYYDLGKIKDSEVKKYIRSEATANMLDAGHYGPWIKK